VHREDQNKLIPAEMKKNQDVQIPVNDRVANSWEEAMAIVWEHKT
jgi:hypothetical protein